MDVLKLVIGLGLKITIILLMVSMGLRMTQQTLTCLWRRPRLLVASLTAAFVVVPVATYFIIRGLPMAYDTKVGLWVVAITPGAPMIHAAAARRGLGNSELAASFQVAVALLVIVFAPMWMEIIGLLTGSDYRTHPLVVARQVFMVQLAPILVGLVIHRRFPRFAVRVGDAVVRFGYFVLIGISVVIVVSIIHNIMRSTHAWNLLGTVLVVTSAILAGHLLAGRDLTTRVTIADANAQRNPGLALAIATWNLPQQKSGTMLAVVIYIVVAVIGAGVYTAICKRLANRRA